MAVLFLDVSVQGVPLEVGFLAKDASFVAALHLVTFSSGWALVFSLHAGALRSCFYHLAHLVTLI